VRLSRRLRLTAAAATAVGLALTAPAVAGAAPSSAGRENGKPGTGAFDHLFVIMLENHSRSSVIDDPNAPYLTGLAHDYAMADDYYGVTHPSMPNYIATLAGDNFGIQDDDDQNVVNLDRKNLVDQLEGAHVSWDAYLDTLPANKLDRFGPTVPAGTDADPAQDGIQVALYAKKHNPFVLFDDITSDPARMDHVRDYTQLSADLDGPDAPQFVWISPNQCNDMHGGVTVAVDGHPETPCPYGVTKDDPNDAALKQKADAFVQGAVSTITQSRAWTKRSAIVIVTDENDFTGNEETGGWETADGCCDSPYVAAHDPRVSDTWPGGTYGGGLIPAIIVTAAGPRHAVDSAAYNHYSLLTTIEDNWHLGHLGHAGDTANGVVPMWPVFTGTR
jgi:phosphatidylinositol-3-phosphatase